MYTYKNQLNLKSCGATVAKDYYDWIFFFKSARESNVSKKSTKFRNMNSYSSPLFYAYLYYVLFYVCENR